MQSLALLVFFLGLAAAADYAPALSKYSDNHYSPSFFNNHYGGSYPGSYGSYGAPQYGGHYGAPNHYAPAYGYGHNGYNGFNGFYGQPNFFGGYPFNYGGHYGAKPLAYGYGGYGY